MGSSTWAACCTWLLSDASCSGIPCVLPRRPWLGWCLVLCRLTSAAACLASVHSQATDVLAGRMAYHRMQNWTAAKGVLCDIASTLQHDITYIEKPSAVALLRLFLCNTSYAQTGTYMCVAAASLECTSEHKDAAHYQVILDTSQGSCNELTKIYMTHAQHISAAVSQNVFGS